MDIHKIIEAIGAVVTVASLTANFVAPWTIVGKLAHWLALNGPTIQSAVAEVAGEKKS